MSSWPSIVAPSNMTGEPVNPAITSEMETGIVVSRAKHTRTRERITVGWTAMPSTDFDTLMTFYKDTVKGSAEVFTWIQPMTGVSFTMRILVLSYEAVPPNHWAVTVQLEEA